MSWTFADFKSTSLEVGQWCWGTMEGAFNEKQTISQVIVDAVIGMIPLLGDATACRDLLAVSIGMCSDPRKRVDRMQWLLLVILLFALIPVVGGVIKGVGRLLMRVTGNVAKDTALLAEIVQFLNRVGHGNAPEWIKSLNVLKYQAQLIDKCHAFTDTVRSAIKRTLDARVGKLLPNVWREKIKMIGDQFGALRDLAEKMIPQALQDFHTKLVAVQRLLYKGELHEIATGGMPKIKREAEAYLEERKVAVAARRGEYGPAKCRADDGLEQKEVQRLYQPKIDEGWPDILRGTDTAHPQFPKKKIYKTVASFHGPIRAVDASGLAGKTLYRAFGNAEARAGESIAGGMFWGVGEVPKNAEEWRMQSAVLDEWNADGFIAVLHMPTNIDALPELKGWIGQIAEQYGRTIPEQYLNGGGTQLFVRFNEAFTDAVTKAGELIKAGKTPDPVEFSGLKVMFQKTGWIHTSYVYGYGVDREMTAATTRRLAAHAVEAKETRTAPAN